jgi:hypothetical protein
MFDERILGDYPIKKGCTLHLHLPGDPIPGPNSPSHTDSVIDLTIIDSDYGTISCVRVRPTDPISAAAPSLTFPADDQPPGGCLSPMGARAWLSGAQLDTCRRFQDYTLRNGMVLHVACGMRIWIKRLTGKHVVLNLCGSAY